MTQAKICIRPDDLITFIAGIFIAKGMSETDARIMAEVLTWADRRGVTSHGVGRLAMYLRILDSGEMDPRAVPVVIDNAPALFTIDAKRSGGAVAMKLLMEEAARRARQFGSVMGLLRGATHTGAIGHYVWKAAEQGFVAIHLNSGPPNMAYHGARVPSLATSPIAIGVPTEQGPLVLDMATSAIANGRLQQALANGTPIPEGSALTADGEPTTDASKADLLLPLGGPKGSGLSFMIECLSSVLASNPILLNALAPGGKRRNVHNALFMLIDIGKLRPLDEFKREMSALGQLMKDLPRLDPQVEILLPGERSRLAYAASTAGVPIANGTWKKLRETAQSLGVTAPEPMA